MFMRHPRSIDSRPFWKASEWRNWLLYYTILSLSDILPQRYLHHWSLLAQATFLTFKNEIVPEDVNNICQIAHGICVSHRNSLWRGNSSNIHQLTHHAKSVKLLGPAWSRSAFVFESSNGHLLKLITAANGVPLQIFS